MLEHQIAIRDAQKESWNTFSPGWRNWDDFTMRFLNTQGEQIIQHLDLKSDFNVLDVATGTGEPGLTIATKVHTGSVTAIDLSEKMLQIAVEKAAAENITNFNTHVADVCRLPFADASFDALSCRLGFMFFPDMKIAAAEMMRVLKPGGQLAVTVWGTPEKNLWITAVMGAIKKYVDLLNPPSGAPGMFRCAQPGCMTALFSEAGLRHGMEIEINGVMECNSTDEYWNFINDVVPPVVSTMKTVDASVREKVKREVYHTLVSMSGDTGCRIPYGARLLKGRKD